ncbi:DUF4843 domain-containing protein [Arachidicoccus terrestris]|uniref:DUF4843 domain-containing protein n=1 Tax=Arachidicoccus terrestris TaxID=2875539 RepID=UPI001CC66DF5|nr:DUF4843 domain-containing protein [Arachidicoccus terrestris]UAY55706.1 DUF4843 domain-containing protein [Arachidicoccus terrestris]
MKQIFTVVLAFGIIAVACKKEEIMTYDAPDNIYFNYVPANAPLDTVGIAFGFSPASVKDTVYKVPLKCTGPVSTHDRTFSVAVDTGTTAVEGTHYILPSSFVFHANQLTDSLPVTIYRTADMQSEPIILRLKLVPSADFQVKVETTVDNFGDTINLTGFGIHITDMVVPGPYWTNVFQQYFGAFSTKKVALINQVTGMPLDYYITGWLTDFYLSSRCSYWAIKMANYLNQQKAAGNAVYEADGATPMTMGTSYQ